ncbi:MAG: C4-type zinc ribbon domain-containing protein [Spirochaetota bacterium]|nr:C4-type zinc ribbon domain-containing protein [Spirochaetota bacterium]
MTDNEIDVPKTIELLVKLQTVAEDFFMLNQEKETLTDSLNIQETLYEDIKNDCNKLNENISSFQNDIEIKQKEIQGYLEDIKKLKDKEKFVKTQKEYIALDTEQSLKRESIQELEKSISEINKQIETIKITLANKNKELNEQETKLNQLKEKTQIKLNEIETNIKKIETVRNEVIPEIDTNILSRYEYIVKNKNGLGIVPIINGICSGCNLAVTPQLIAIIRKNKEIIACSNCARLLYFPSRSLIF